MAGVLFLIAPVMATCTQYVISHNLSLCETPFVFVSHVRTKTCNTKKQLIKKYYKIMKYENLEIGTKVFLIHTYNFPTSKIGARIIIAKVKTFERTKSGIEPILTEIGNSKRELKSNSFKLFTDIKQALKEL